MREAFERWAVVEGLPVNKGSKKEYLNVKTRLAWRAWKAGVLSVANQRWFMGEWVKCNERMPEHTQMLLAFSQGEIVAAYWNWIVNPIDYKKYRGFTYLSGYPLEGVTHWMPLPEPPEV